jgi:hypothetical protein
LDLLIFLYIITTSSVAADIFSLTFSVTYKGTTQNSEHGTEKEMNRACFDRSSLMKNHG